MKVLIIIPCYNEEKNIVKTVNEIKKYNYDYIIINDGSTDNSLDLIKKHKYNCIYLINNSGIGAAMQTGYKYALENNYDIAVQFDGDGQHDASFIEKIVKPIKNREYDMVIGSRFVGDESKFKSTKLRRIGIKLLSLLLKIFTKKQIFDITSGFRAVNKKIIKYFCNNYPYEFPEPVTNFMLSKYNFKILEIPVKMNARKHGKSSINRLISFYYMFNIIVHFLVLFFIKGDDDYVN